MTKLIDCLFIGHNEMDFADYEKRIRGQGIQSGAYRDLNLSFIQYNHKPYTFTRLFNTVFGNGHPPANEEPRFKPISLGETFSLAIAYLGSYLDERGFTFDFIHYFQDEKEALAEKLINNQILTIAIITTLYFDSFAISEIINFIKKYNITAKIIVGGPYILSQLRILDPVGLEFLLEHLGADFYVNSSQGETTLVRIIETLKKGKSWDSVNNIHFKTTRGYTSTPILKENNRLCENPVKWDLFAGNVDQYVAIRTAISCPFSCAFCLYPENEGEYQPVDVKYVEQELDRIEKLGTVKSVNIIDDTFNVPPNRFKEILEMMIRNKYQFKWHSYFRCQFADRETIELMKESGCEGVFLGLESGNNQILKKMNKMASVEKYRQGLQLLTEFQIVTFGSFILGFPGETRETAADTIKLIKESGLDFYEIKLWYYDPNMPIGKERERYNIKNSNYEWSHSTMNYKTASDLIDEAFVSIEESVWCPEFNFGFANLFHLQHRGLTLEEIKNLLRTFNQGIKQKLLNPAKKETTHEIISRFKKCLHSEEKKQDFSKYNAEFNF